MSLTAGTSANLSPCTTLTIFRVSLCQVGDYIRGLPDDQRFYVKFQSACSNLPAKSTRESLSDWAERRVAVLRGLLLVAVCPTCVPVAARYRRAVSLQTQLVILHSSDVFSCLVYLSRRAFKPAAVRDEGQACGTPVDFVSFPTEQRHKIRTWIFFGAPVVL